MAWMPSSTLENWTWNDIDGDTHYFYLGMTTHPEASSTNSRASESNLVQYMRPSHKFAYVTIVRKAVFIHGAYMHMCVVCLAVMQQDLIPSLKKQGC